MLIKDTRIKIPSLALYCFVLLLILTSGCKEVPPFIDYNPPIKLARDTTYLLNDVPERDNKNVLIEDVSGVRCVNCPEAAAFAHGIKDRNNIGRVVVLTLHSNKFDIFTRPISDTFNTDEATQIVDNLLGSPQGLPTGAVDRTIFPGKTDALLNPGTWESYANQQLALKSKANLEVNLVVDKVKRSVIANVKATFIDDFPEGAYLSVFISESHIISHQEFPTGLVDNFEHNFILRKGVTAYNGLKLADNIESKRVFEKGFEFEIPEKYVFDNCNVVVLINKIKDKENEVVQSVEKQLKP